MTITVGGFPTTGLREQTFYGFRYNPDTGHLDIELINDSNPGLIKLPDEVVVRNDDYAQWAWSQETLDFSWADNGYLQVEIL